VTPAGSSMPGGIQPLARSVASTVVLSARSPIAQANRGCWRATAPTSLCSRARAVALADAAPATAPVAVAATAWVPRLDATEGCAGAVA